MTPEIPNEPTISPLPPPTLDAASDDDQGRIGYGTYARYTPFGLAAVIVAVLLVIAIVQRDSGDPAASIGQLVGQPAADINLTTFDGKTVRLADYRGSVAVVNFWAQWCVPCKEEMPAFQAISTSAAASGEKLAIIGVNIKNDTAADAQAFATSLGITYPIGHDVSPGGAILGLIETSYGMGGQYPATVFIRPNGIIDSVHFGPMTSAEIQKSITAATKV